MTTSGQHDLIERFRQLTRPALSALDIVPGETVVEKVVDLLLTGVPAGPQNIRNSLEEVRQALQALPVDDIRIVVFGGGTGLSNIVGGDSLQPEWKKHPFRGLKEVFPHTTSVVCVTDDGGSTGELLKNLPVIGLGDLRHVLLSSVRPIYLHKRYGITDKVALDLVAALARLMNYRFDEHPGSFVDLFHQTGLHRDLFPARLIKEIFTLGELLFKNPLLQKTLDTPQCLGNLLLAAAIFDGLDDGSLPAEADVLRGVNRLGYLVGAGRNTVLPCCTTPSQLKVLYSNGVVVTGENKTAGARRGYPVERAFVDYLEKPRIPKSVLRAVKSADICIFAPGSLYTSIIPVLQVPGLADAVRTNRSALKIMVANIWAQAGETDMAREDPNRRYQVSDLLKAFQYNVADDFSGLFQVVMLLGLKDIPGSIIQRYAVEGKTPIYCDRQALERMGLAPLEAKIFSRDALHRGTVKHAPHAFAEAVRILWSVRDLLPERQESFLPDYSPTSRWEPRKGIELPCRRYAEIVSRLQKIGLADVMKCADIFWRHQDIPVSHLAYVESVCLDPVEGWERCQEWDNVFSFYEPETGCIHIREDLQADPDRFEIAFLVALGQSLLGNYAGKKTLSYIDPHNKTLGRIYNLRLRPQEECSSFLDRTALEQYLRLARMNKAPSDPNLFHRVLNGTEGFTPPGMLFGLIYAWYLNNLFASHIEYKMGIARMPVTNLVPEQVRALGRRQEMVTFFRKIVFGH